MLCHTATVALLAMADGPRPAAIGARDHAEVPARCHYTDAADADRCDIVLDAIADAWVAQVEGAGFAPPMPDDDGVLDFYLTTEGTYGGAYAVGPYTDEDPDDGRMGCHAYVALDRGIDDADLPGYVAHEFNHVLQYGTDFTEPTLPIWEAVATSAERTTYPEAGLDSISVMNFQDDPWLGLLGDAGMLPQGTWSLYEYGAVLWILHLDDREFAGAGAAGAELWWAATQEGWDNEPDVLDAYDALTGGWQAALMDLSLERAWVGTDHAPAWAAPWTDRRFSPAVADRLEPSDLPARVTPTSSPLQTGAVYLELSGWTPGEPVTVAIEGAESVSWGLLLADGPDGTWELGRSLTWTPTTDTVVFGAVNLGEDGFDADRTLRPAALTLSVAAGTEPAEARDSADGGSDDAASKPPQGCGCAAPLGAPAGLLLTLPLLAAARRSRVQAHRG